MSRADSAGAGAAFLAAAYAGVENGLDYIELIGMGAVAGAGWGALIGHFIKRDRWVPASGHRRE